MMMLGERQGQITQALQAARRSLASNLRTLGVGLSGKILNTQLKLNFR